MDSFLHRITIIHKLFMKEVSKHPHRIFQYQVNRKDLFPNNPELPALWYRSALLLPYFKKADFICRLFEKNNWTNNWDDTILTESHFHSNTHEVIGIYGGSASLVFGGGTVSIDVSPGDVIIIPAGVAHSQQNIKEQLRCVGGYPNGLHYDMHYGRKEENLEELLLNIENVALPTTDPVYGKEGPLVKAWQRRKSAHT